MRIIGFIMIMAGALAAASCASKGDRSAATTRPAESMTDDAYEVPPPRDSVSRVMQAKLAHAQALLEGIALGEFAQVENNALALKRISQGGEWLVHDSVAYFDFSTEFRAICDDLVNQARARNEGGAVAAYGQLANSCVACHTYLRREAPARQMPGRVSLRGGAG
jgi:hypothetical protein